ncbi:unnamed protein product, partial [Ixodes persulcatus]
LFFSRKFELYSMKWQEQGLNLSEFIVAAAPYGGPIAIIRDEKKIMKIKLSSVCLIHLFSASGQTLGNIRHDSGIIVAMGWSNTESLVCVQKDGVIIEYNLLGKILETFTMGQVPKDTNVLDCKIFTTSQRTGVGVLTGSYSFFLVESISSHKTWQLPEILAYPNTNLLLPCPGMVAPPSSWTIIADEQGTRVVVAKDDKIFVLDPRGSARCIEETPPITTMFKAVTEMAVSFDYRNIALFLDDGHLWIGTSDLRSTLCELDTKEKSRPKQLLWCGQKAVVGHWGKILLCTISSLLCTYPVDVPIHLVQEVDGVRLIGNTIHELLQKVPNVVKDVFRIGSMDPGALLLAASVEFEKKSYKADEYLRSIIEENNLELAIQQCIDAAAHEYPSATQKKLLRAACFGKSFIPSMNPDGFVNACRTLRVLNAVREHTVGLPLTYVQLQCLTMEVLLDRLILRQHYYLALKIAKFLRIPDTEGTSRILAHWACYKVAQMHVPTDEVARAISQKLESSPGILYSEIARKAVQCGRRDLAVKLLDCEPRASEQVPILIELGKEEHALVKAIDSGDTDLICFILGQSTVKGSTHTTTNTHTKCASHRIFAALDWFYAMKEHIQGDDKCRNWERKKIPKAQVENKFERREAIQKGRRLKNTHCMHAQKKKKAFHPKTVAHKQKRFRRGDKLKNKLCTHEKKKKKLSSALLQGGSDEMRKKEKLSPYNKRIMEVLSNMLEYHQKLTLVTIINELVQRCNHFFMLNNLDEAAKFAFEQKDENALNFILSKCTAANRAISEKISTMKQQLGGKR